MANVPPPAQRCYVHHLALDGRLSGNIRGAVDLDIRKPGLLLSIIHLQRRSLESVCYVVQRSATWYPLALDAAEARPLLSDSTA